MKFTVAIDGPAAAGKGTISKAVAAHFGYAHLDTGLLYRAVGRRVLNGDNPLSAASSLSPEDLARGDLRTSEVARVASEVAALPEVRAALVAFQRDFARRDGGAVLDGRDIGTVICQGAEVKLFVTASDAVRAARRLAELLPKNTGLTLDDVLRDLRERDARDRDRAAAPLMQAGDAMLIDTSEMNIAAAVAVAVSAVKERLRAMQ